MIYKKITDGALDPAACSMNQNERHPTMTTKGFTYFCTDRHGNVYDRYSAGHIEPRYFFAAVERIQGTTVKVHKTCVSYSAQQASVANRAARAEILGHYNFKTGKLDPVEAEVIPVRAYPGRHKVEPTVEPTAGSTI